MIPLEEAQRFVLESCAPLAPRSVALDDALGCVVPCCQVASEPVPPFTNSSMDGYALRAEDTSGAPVRLEVVGEIRAGRHPLEVVGPGQAIRIMTGAPLPEGANAVAMVEETRAADDGASVRIERQIQVGDFVRRPGRDVAVGDVIAQTGAILTPAHLGMLASQAVTSVIVHPHPKVGVLSTGDELFDGRGPLPLGRIRDANRHTLLGLVQRASCQCVDLGIVGDDEDALVAALTRAAKDCDAIITSGGVSVGDFDVVRIVLERMSAGSMRCMQIAIRPAKPFAFGTLAGTGTPVFGLPGNPVSAMVSFELLARPALRLLAGHRVLHRPTLSAVAEDDVVRQPDGKLHLLRAWVTLDRGGAWRVSMAEGQESDQLHAMATANGLALLPDGRGVDAGDQVDVFLLDPDTLGNGTGSP